jgi:hypothetical protein
MHKPRRLAAVLAAALPLVATAAPAVAAPAAPAGHHLTLAQQVAASKATAHRIAVSPDTDLLKIKTLNGQHNCVGYIFAGTGHPVVQKADGTLGCEVMLEHFVTTDINGFPEYKFSFTSESNTTYLAATTSCDKATKKGSTGDGTVWIIYTAPNDNQYLVPRFCVGMDEYDVQLGADNVVGDQWDVTSNLADYRALILQAA